MTGLEESLAAICFKYNLEHISLNYSPMRKQKPYTVYVHREGKAFAYDGDAIVDAVSQAIASAVHAQGEPIAVVLSESLELNDVAPVVPITRSPVDTG